MLSNFRFSCGGVSRVLGISALIAILFVAGCTTNGKSTQFGVATTSGQLATVVVNNVYPGATLTAANGTAPYTWAITSGALPIGLTLSSAGAISGTPTQSGAFTFTVTVMDSATPAHTASASLTLAINQAPAITSGTAATFTVGASGTFTVTATGFPAPTYTETGALPSGVTLNATTGVLSGTPAAGTGKTYPITITAQNGIGTNATQSFTLTVNQAPAITSQSSISFVSGALGTFTVTATSFPAAALSVTGTLPTGVTFNTTTGILSGTPSGAPGNYPLVFTAANGIGTNATQNFTLTVGAAPAITSGSSATFTVGAAGTFTVTATGFPAPTFTETGALPSGVTLNSTTGALSGTPAAGTGKAYPITITAQNGVGSNAAQSFTLTVNQAPAITSGSSNTFVVGTAGTFTVTATGFPAPTFSETGALPTGVTLNPATGVLGGTPASGMQGTYSIVISAQNGIGANATQNFTLTVDLAPSITSGNSTTFTAGSVGTFTVTAAGFPAPTFTETGALPTGVTLNSTTGALSGTPGAGTGKSYPITITAQNGVGTNATQSFTLTVDQAPAITSGSSTTFAVSSLSSFTVVATGFPAPTYTETGALPTGVTLNSTTGVLGGTPATGTQNTYPITITAQNGIGTNATQSFTLIVSFTAPPSFTSSNNATFTTGTPGTFTVTASGAPAPTFSETGSLPSGVTLNTTTGVLSGTPAAATGGSYPITITAQNGITPNATQSFTLTVDQSPAITSLNNATFTVGANGTFVVTTTGNPTAGLTETGALPSPITFVDNGNGTATISGTPSGASVIPITITASNGIGSNATQSFTLTVTAVSCTTNCTISGTVTGAWGSGVIVSRSGSITPATTDANGKYSFTGLAGGTYTITPSLPGYTYSPVAPQVATSASTTAQDFVATSAVPSFSISGTVSGSSAVGIVYVRVFNCGGGTNCNSRAGTALASISTNGGAYTVRGLPPGNYSVGAEIDTLNTGAGNESNPAGSISGVSITSANVTGANIIVGNQTIDAAVTPDKPSVFPGSGAAFISYNQPTSNTTGEEIATSYKIYYDTDSGFSHNTFKTISPGDSNNVYVLSGLTNATAYWFKMSALNANGESTVPAASVVGPVTINATGAATGPNTVSGSVTFSGVTLPLPAGAALYVGVFSNTSGVYFERIASPVSGVAYSVSGIPSGTYQHFAVLDLSGTGVVGAGSVTNFGPNGPPSLTVTTSISGSNIALTSVTARTFISTSHERNGGTDTYGLGVSSDVGTKRPISMTLFSGNNVAVPFDMVAERNNTFNPIFNSSVRPLTTDTYGITVTFSDSTTVPNLPSSLVTTVRDTFATSLSMITTGAGTPTVPVLSWAAPSPLPTFPYSYSVSLNGPGSGSGVFWNYSGGHNSNGIPSTQTNVPYNVDGNANPNAPLVVGTTYNWSVTVRDDTNNTASFDTTYTP